MADVHDPGSPDSSSPPGSRFSLSRLLAVLGLGTLLGLALWWLPGGDALSQPSEPARPVVVTNLPQVQQVDGEVSIRGLVPHTRFVAWEEETVVSAAPRSQATQLVEGGALETGPFRRVVLSLTGVVKGEVEAPGKVGALLIPDVEPARRAFDTEGVYLLPLEVTAPVGVGDDYVASAATEQIVAFPRYRVWLYNSTERPVGVRLFAHMSY